MQKGHHPEVTVRLKASFPRFLASLVALAALAKATPGVRDVSMGGTLVSRPHALSLQRDLLGRYASEAARLEGTASLGALFGGGLDALKEAMPPP